MDQTESPLDYSSDLIKYIQGRMMELDVPNAHRIVTKAGRPAVDFLFQLCQIWGINWTHQSTVPIVPSMLATNGISVWGAIGTQIHIGNYGN